MTSNEQISEVVKLWRESQRPIFIWGAGMRPYRGQALDLARSLGIPIACTWGSIDLINHEDKLFAGGFGTHGTRASNFAVQSSDLVIAIGSRLDTKATGQVSHFARAAKICMVDIDRAELDKFQTLGRPIDIPICMDAGEFIEALSKHEPVDRYPHSWPHQIKMWREKYDTPTVTWPGINPYELMKEIAKWTTPEDIIVSDTGTVLGYIMQGFPFKGERFLHAFNMTPMGWGLPAAIGASLASQRRVVLVTGDGSIMMAIGELATVARWGLNIKIILLNNGQHSMCVQTERQWFGGRNASTTVESGLGFPKDWIKLADSFGIRAYDSYDGKRIKNMSLLFEGNDPAFMEIKIHPDATLIPQAAFGVPLEDGAPLLPFEELQQQMLIPALERK